MAQLKQSISSRSASFTYARRALSALVVAIVLAPCRQLPDTRYVTPVYARIRPLSSPNRKAVQRLASPAFPALGRRRVKQHNAAGLGQLRYFRVILLRALPFAKRHNLPPLFHQRQHPNVHLLNAAYAYPAQADSATPAWPSGDNAPVHSAARAFRIVRR